jgi:hypothetical protein
MPSTTLVLKSRGRNKQVKLTQDSYTRGVLERHGILESKPKPTPMVQLSDMMQNSTCSESDSKRMIGVTYREAI